MNGEQVRTVAIVFRHLQGVTKENTEPQSELLITRRRFKVGIYQIYFCSVAILHETAT
jgi:hypothetical protein